MKTYLIFESKKDEGVRHLNMDKAKALICVDEDRIVSLRDNFNEEKIEKLRGNELVTYDMLPKRYIIFYEKSVSTSSWSFRADGKNEQCNAGLFHLTSINEETDDDALMTFNLLCEV